MSRARRRRKDDRWLDAYLARGHRLERRNGWWAWRSLNRSVEAGAMHTAYRRRRRGHR